MSPKKWIEATDAIGIVSKAGRYGGTYAHSDIAMSFATWISPEFQLYIMKDYRRLKTDENSRLSLNWNLNREISNFWTECIVFISKDNNLNKAHIKYLENHLYILAKESKRYEIVNSNVPTEASISEMDRAEMDEFIDNMRLILGVLGHKILEPSIKRKSDEKEILYILQDRSGIKASGKPISEGFAVLKGSKVANNVATSLSKSVINKRQLLFDKGIVDKNFTFTQDWAFTSPSLAAAIVVGYSINGRNAWKNKKGVSLKEIEEG